VQLGHNVSCAGQCNLAMLLKKIMDRAAFMLMKVASHGVLELKPAIDRCQTGSALIAGLLRFF
jgi:hypothetical protein